MPPYEPFSCDIERADDRVLVRVAGELDMAAVPDLEKLVATAGDATHLVVDLSGLTFIDSSGMRMLLGVQRDSQERGVSLSMVPGPEGVQRTFQLAGLIGTFPFQRPEGSSTASASG